MSKNNKKKKPRNPSSTMMGLCVVTASTGKRMAPPIRSAIMKVAIKAFLK